MKPYYEHAGIRIYVGDCCDIVPQLAERFDACVTDPPYHLTSLSRRSSPRQNDPATPFGRTRLGSAGFMGKTWDGGDVAFRPETWQNVLNVLKPGAHLLAFGGTRTHHRLTCAIEDAGFEIRDMLMWLYGSGFPKSLDISKAIDKAAGAERLLGPKRIHADGTVAHNRAGVRNEGYERPWRSDAEAVDRNTRTSFPATDAAKFWDGYGTALKPAWEPIILAMRPCEGTFAENALEHGVAGLNIDGSRIGTGKDVPASASGVTGIYENGHKKLDERSGMDPNVGRWPSNLLLDEESARQLDQQSGDRSSPRANGNPKNPVSGKIPSQIMSWGGIREHNDYRDSGGASRFFYTAKADSTERGTGNNHPTVKPLDLMRYLCKLLAPPRRGLFLDPFAGSGSTLIACKALNVRAVGIELSEQYAEIAAKRLSQDVIEFDQPEAETAV